MSQPYRQVEFIEFALNKVNDYCQEVLGKPSEALYLNAELTGDEPKTDRFKSYIEWLIDSYYI